jgi:hypothetical protein
MSYKALVTGNAQDLSRPYEQTFGKKHGVAQMITHAEDIYNGTFNLKQPLGQRKILPVLIVSSFLPSEPLHYKFFEELLTSNGIKFNKYYLLPFIYLTIEEAEYLEALSTVMSSSEIEDLLVMYSHKVHDLNIDNDFSFKNFLFSKRISVPNNSPIVDGYMNYTDKLLRRHFPKEYEESQSANKAKPVTDK